ncbi:Hypothetical predicted protein [Pelobates cultripes]|uniref:Uncharacterized protein n=1 Tax=Pelobates cultripes TaxID=61616 RepID=A0AAD1WQP7_PELCU|nr:Hypothetical predicted protein [Pelobates cultripes]
MTEYVTAHNNLTDQVQQLQQQVTALDSKMMDAENRARRNNLRLRGVPETVFQDDFPAYVRSLMDTLAQDIPAEMLLLDRVHCVPRSRYLPDTTPRNVLLRAHYYNIKELILKSSHMRIQLPFKYATVKLFTDLSAATLRRCKAFNQVTTL